MIVESAFVPAWWLPGPHGQTIFPALLRPTPKLSIALERFELPDGDFVDLAWVEPSVRDARAPIVLVLPGLGGSIRSKYARGILREGHRRGWRVGLIHFRGGSGTVNRRRISYHAGATADPRAVFGGLRERYPEATLAALGFSLGGSVLLNLLGEDGEACPLSFAAVASTPLQLAPCAGRLQQGFSRVYDAYLAQDLRRQARARMRVHDLGIEAKALARLRSIRTFDDAVTAPVNGFADVDDYYARCSALPKLRGIRRPTLVVQSEDDPFLAASVPAREDLSSFVTVEVSRKGGHVGFVQGSPLRPRYWLEHRLLGFLAEGFEGRQHPVNGAERAKMSERVQ